MAEKYPIPEMNKKEIKMKNVKHLFLLVLCSLLLIPVAASSGNILTLEPFSIKGGETKDLVIDLENDMEITLVQFDLKLPEGLSVEDKGTATKPKYQIKLYDDTRTTLEDHQVSSNYVVDSENGNYYKVILSSSDNTEITGNSGALLKISLCAASTFKTGTITLKNILLVAPDETPVHPDPVSLDITLPKVTVTINNAERKYGENNPQFTYTASTNDNLTGLVTLNCEATKTSNVGEYAITGTSTATDLEVTFVNGKLTVNPAALTVTADAKTKTFGAADPELTYVATGLVNGDQLTGALTRAEGQTVGTYAIEQGTLAASSNYTLTFNGANLTITAKSVTSLTIELETSTFSYDGTAKEPAVTVKDGQTVIPASEYTVSYSNNTNAGTATVTITDKDGGNYTVNGSTTFTITAKSVTAPTIELATSAIVYDGTAKEPGVTVKDGTTTIPASEYTVSYSNNTNAGTATITITDKDGGNYAVSGSTTFTITAKSVTAPTIELATSTFGYDGTAKEPGVTVKDGTTTIPASEYTVSYSNNTNAGTAAVTITDKDGGNYAINGSANFTITKAVLKAKAGDASRTYGAANPAFTVSYEGFLNGDTEASLSTKPTATTTATVASDAGAYDITVAGGAADNYEFSYTAGKLTVTKAALSAKAGDASRIYGAANPAFTISYEGFLNGDTEASLSTKPTATTTASAASAVGDYDITLAGGASDNYDLSYTTGKLTVTPAPLTVKAKDVTRFEGNPNPAFEIEYTGFVNGETAAVLTTQPTATTTATSQSPVGVYDITVSGGAAQNYTLTYVNGKLTVADKSSITITAKSASRIYGAANPQFEYTVMGGELQGTPSLTCEAVPGSPVGTYIIKVEKGSITTDANFVFNDGQLTVTKAPLTATANATRYYGEDNPTLDVTYSGFVNGETAAVLKQPATATTTATKSSPAGYYTINVTGGEADNYAITCQDGSLTVNKANLHVYVTDVTRVYGEQNPQFTCRYDGFVNGDTQSAVKTAPSLTTTATASSPIGTYTITAAGGSADNYNFISVDGWLNVTKAPLTITATDATRYVGFDEPEFTFTCNGFVNGDDLKALKTMPTLTTNAKKDSPAGKYTITADGAVADNYDISYVDGVLTITELETFEDKGATYDVESGNEVSFAGVAAASETTTPVTTCEIPATVTFEGNTYDVKAIAAEAFKGNTTIEEVAIPASIVSIGARAFAGCTSLKQLIVNILKPLVLPSAQSRAMTAGAAGTVFEGVDFETCVLYVPEASVELYKAADGWKEFKTILPIASVGIDDFSAGDKTIGDVYDLRGRKIRAAAKSLDGLPKGVYIVGGKKVTK